VIYNTNVRTAYQAGRWKQMTDPELLKLRPYLVYHHGDSRQPRPDHLSWDGLVLPADDPWWQTHYTPNGWGCTCSVFSVGPRDLERMGKSGPDTAPPIVIDAKTGAPVGIDKGWDYNVGQAAEKSYKLLADKFETLPNDFARAWMIEFLTSEAFTAFFNGEIKGAFPVAVLKAEDMKAMGSKAQSVWLSQETVAEHIKKHPEIGLADYQRIPEILDLGEVYLQGNTRLVYLQHGKRFYRAALKRTKDGDENYFLTLFETTDAKAKEEIRKKYKRVR